MTDLLWPSQVIPGETTLSPVSNIGVYPSPQTGATRTIDRSGHRWRASLAPPNLKRTDGSALRAFLAWLHGGNTRVLSYDHSYVKAGLFAAPELLPNPTFENGLTEWSSTGNTTRTVSERVYRATAVGSIIASTDLLRSSNPIPVTQFAAYVLRIMVLQRSYTGEVLARIRDGSGGAALASGPVSSAGGMHIASYVSNVTSLLAALNDSGSASVDAFAGQFLEIPFASLSRCLLVDAQPNGLLHSDDHENTAAWGVLTANGLSGVTANTSTSPRGTATANKLVENSANAQHYRAQSYTVPTAATDLAASQEFKAAERGFGYIWLSHAGGTAIAYINLSTGAITNASAGTDWANLRTFAVNKGDGWWTLHVVATKSGAQTSVEFRAGMAQVAGTGTYTGDGTSGLLVGRSGFVASGAPFDAGLTTTAASSGSSPSGGTIRVKGGRTPSEGALAGALLVGDQAGIQTGRGPHLMMATAPLDLDAAGLGTFLGRVPLLGTVLDNAPISLYQPMTRWIPVNPQTGWRNRAGGFMEPEPLELMQDIAPA